MNPVTRSLLEKISDHHIIAFVENWDALEMLVVRVYKGKRAAPADQTAYRRLRRKLQKQTRQFAEALAPYWQQTTINEQPVTADPFKSLIEPADAAAFIDSWQAMQTLPAARQALNEWLLDKVNSQN